MPKRLTPRGEAAPPVEPINTGASIPPKQAAAKRTPRPKATKPGIMYVRNLHHIDTRVRLGSGRVIELKPRGQREDIDIVNVDEQQDPKFLANKGLIFELLDAAVAEEIIARQQTNSNRAASDDSIWKHLRNEKGEAYEQTGMRVEEAFERQGTVVGRVESTGDGRFTQGNSAVARVSGAGPEIAQVPGSPGHPATQVMQSVPAEISPEDYHEFLLWKQFKDQQAKGDA